MTDIEEIRRKKNAANSAASCTNNLHKPSSNNKNRCARN